jgi:uncharacterized protein (TIGR03083 family)
MAAPETDAVTAVRTAFLGALVSFRDLAADDVVAAAWHEPSALAGYSVGGLVGHAVSCTQVIERYLDRGAGGGVPIEKGAYYGPVPSPSQAAEMHAGIRARGDQVAEAGPRSVVAELDALRARLDERLAAEPRERTIVVVGGATMRLDDYLETRIVELVVHHDDVARSVAVATIVPPEALGVAVEHLVAVARGRHGDLAVLRAFARRERDDRDALHVF